MVFSGALSKQEIEGLEEVVNPSEAWRKKATCCSFSGDTNHTWIPISWQISATAKHVKTLMCTSCFHEINIAEAFQHRIKA
jgi:hypothetical protein